MAGFAICGFQTAASPQLVMLGLQLRVASGSRCSTPTICGSPRSSRSSVPPRGRRHRLRGVLPGCEIVDGSDRARPGPQSFAGAFPVFREIGHTPEGVFREQLQQVELTAAGARHLCFHGDLFGLLFLGNVALPSSALIRRQFLEQIGAFDGSLRMAEETEFFHRAAAYSPVVIVMSPLVRYRAAESDSITAGRNAAALTEIALRSLNAASTRRPLRAADREALEAGRRHLLLRLAYAHLSARDGVSTRAVLRRVRRLGLPLGRRGGALWVASLLPPAALDGMHRGKRLLRRTAGRP